MKAVTHVFSRGLLVKPESGLMPDYVLYQLAKKHEETGRMCVYAATQYGAFMGIVTPFPPLEGKFAYAEHVTYPNGLMECYQIPEIPKEAKKCRTKKTR